MVDASDEIDRMEDVKEIGEILQERDTEAFIRGDWSAVAEDFDSGAFVGYVGGETYGEPWKIGYSTLEAYREDWLNQSSELLREVGSKELQAQFLAASQIADVQIRGRYALARKEFDGEVGSTSHCKWLLWRTYYFLRKDPDRWRITGFVGFLPYEGHAR